VLQPSYLERAQRFASFAREHGYSPSVLALAWLLSHPEITSVITGASTIAELDENSRATTLTLSSEERATLDALLPPHEFPPSASSK
jgi:aryl-alcohol dehydrogenase-like predicted oxidoreductase